MFDYQAAFCWRNTALYGGLFLFGLLYFVTRNRHVPVLSWLMKPVKLWGFLLFLLPMAVDGFSHMFGFRDMSEDVLMDMWYGWTVGSEVFSFNWWIRIITGLLAALGAVKFAFPRIDKVVEQSEAMRLMYLESARASQRQVAVGSGQ